MSRSLDKAVLASLQTQDPRPAYKDISTLFSDNFEELETGRASPLLEIEFLGTSHPLEDGVNYLRDEFAVAIPKLRLTQAFLVARQYLQEHLASRPVGATAASSSVIPDQVLAATAVILLMDPEHLTAANTRKRALQHKLASLTGVDDKEDAAGLRYRAMQAEQHFVNSLLTSRLHRHTKSPTLWSHRQWLLKLCQREGIRLAAADDDDDFSEIIMVSGERHPRNYYAWNHARWLLLNRRVLDDPSLPAGNGQQQQQQQQQRLEKLSHDVKNWCLKHHGDISGWSFLAFVLGHMRNGQRQATLCNAVMQDVLRIVESFRWSGESVWVFLRHLVATHAIDEDNSAWFRVLENTLGFRSQHI